MNNKSKELIFASFEETLRKKVPIESASKIIKKGEEIFRIIESTNRLDKKFLMAGKIQSGKTLNFISVIASAIKGGFKLFIIMTGTDNELDSQTSTRLKETLGYNENGNFLKFYSSGDIYKNDFILKEIIKNIENDRISIITTLKTNVQKVYSKFVSNKILKNEKMLIIDDEGDLASMTHDTKKNSKTYERVEELFLNTNSAFISVTATPYVHILTGINKTMRPNRVFCIEPGDGYQGIDIFTKDNQYYKIVEDIENKKDFTTTNIFGDAVLYYLITAAKLFIDCKLNERSHSNMLVHTDAETDKHKIYKDKIEQQIEHFDYCLNQKAPNIDFTNLEKRINRIILENNLNIEFNDNFIEHLKFCIKNLVVSQINQDEKPEINNNFCNIFIGSQLVGRGLTLDNLLVTFFTYRSKNAMAADTLLQRARWLGYRRDILDYMKVFTTNQIADDYRIIADADNNTWLALVKADQDGSTFDQVSNEIEIYSQKLIPTNKVPLEKQSIKKVYHTDDVMAINAYKTFYTELLKQLTKSKQKFIASNNKHSRYSFNSLIFKNFNELLSVANEDTLIKTLNVNKMLWTKIKKIANENKLRILVSLLDSKESDLDVSTPRVRNCEMRAGSFEIDNIFQGRNTNSKDEINNYVGDLYWHTIQGSENDIILQIHYIDPRNNQKNVLNGENIYAFCLFLPSIVVDNVGNKVFSSKNLEQ